MSDRLTNHVKQDGSLAGTALALGLGAATVAAYVKLDEGRELIAAFAVFTLLPAVVVLIGRMVRPFPRGARVPRACALCGRPGATAPVRYLQITGLVVVMAMREVATHACRRCSVRAFNRTTLHSFALGWWGMFSFFITPGFLLNNLLFLARSFAGTRASAHAHRALEEHREYAQNLLQTKDEATVVDVLARESGVPEAQVLAFVRALGAPRR